MYFDLACADCNNCHLLGLIKFTPLPVSILTESHQNVFAPPLLCELVILNPAS